MIIKTLLFAFLSCSMLGFSAMEDTAKDSLLRTKEGVIIIPASAGVTAQDAKQLASYMNKEEGNVGVLYLNGKPLTETKRNSFGMEDLKAAETAFGVDIIGDGGVMGLLFRGSSVKCNKEHTSNTCKETYKVIVVVEARSQADAQMDKEITNVLDRYGYTTID